MRYFNLIFTNHALDRALERGLTKEIAWKTFNQPDQHQKDNKGATRFVKFFDGYRATVIASQNKKNEWVIISFWRDPPLPGTPDERKKHRWQEYKKAGFWGKILLTVKQQLGF